MYIAQLLLQIDVVPLLRDDVDWDDCDLCDVAGLSTVGMRCLDGKSTINLLAKCQGN